MALVESGRFSQNKLRFLRDLTGESLIQLSNEIGYSTTTISKWEKGNLTPNFKSLIKLSNHFGVNHNFFLTSVEVPDFTGAVFFRKAAVLPKKKVIQAQAKARRFAMVDYLLSKELDLPNFKMPDYAHTSEKFEILSYDDIDNIANKVRNQFSLGDGPISNMTLLVERMGIRVKLEDLDSEKIDAVTGDIKARPYIVLNARRLSSVRIRFNLAHELGHILLHSFYPKSVVRNKNNHRTIESEANHFAGSLLMPDYGIALDMMRTNMSYLIELKKHWKVAIQALIYRGNELGLISDSQALFLRQTIYRNGWRIKEPLDDEIPLEKPSYMKSAIKFSEATRGNSIDVVSQETGLSLSEVREWGGKLELSQQQTHRPNLHLL